MDSHGRGSISSGYLVRPSHITLIDFKKLIKTIIPLPLKNILLLRLKAATVITRPKDKDAPGR